MDDKILTKKFCAKCNQEKLLSDFHKCSRNKTGVQSKCKICMNDYYMKHQEKLIQRTRDWEKNNKQRKKESSKQWILKNKTKRQEVCKRYYENNKDKALEATRKWKTNNHNKLLFYASQRRLIKKEAMPAWANVEKIQEIYNIATSMRKNGMNVHVDHIVPLRNKLVCGLHVHNNLQILDAKENLSKFNKFSLE